MNNNIKVIIMVTTHSLVSSFIKSKLENVN